MVYNEDLKLFVDLPDQTAQSNFSHHREYLARTVIRQISFWYALPSENRIKSIGHLFGIQILWH